MDDTPAPTLTKRTRPQRNVVRSMAPPSPTVTLIAPAETLSPSSTSHSNNTLGTSTINDTPTINHTFDAPPPTPPLDATPTPVLAMAEPLLGTHESPIASSSNPPKTSQRRGKTTLSPARRAPTYPNQSPLVAYASRALQAFEGSVLWHGKLTPTLSREDGLGMTKFLPYVPMLNPRAALWFTAIPWDVITPSILWIWLFITTIGIFSYITGWHQPIALLWLAFTIGNSLTTILRPDDCFLRYVRGFKTIIYNIGVVDAYRLMLIIAISISIVRHRHIVVLSAILAIVPDIYRLYLYTPAWITWSKRRLLGLGGVVDDGRNVEVDTTLPGYCMYDYIFGKPSRGPSPFAIPSKHMWCSDVTYMSNHIVFTGLVITSSIGGQNTWWVGLLRVLPFFLACQYIVAYIAFNRWRMIMEARALLVNLSAPPQSTFIQKCLPTHLRNTCTEARSLEKYERALQAWIHHHLDLVSLPHLAALEFPPKVMERLQLLPGAERTSLLQYISAQYVETGDVRLGLLTHATPHTVRPNHRDKGSKRTLPNGGGDGDGDDDSANFGLCASDYAPDIDNVILPNHQNPLLCRPLLTHNNYPWPINEPAAIVNQQSEKASPIGPNIKGSDVGLYKILNVAIDRFVTQYGWYLKLCQLLSIRPTSPTRSWLHNDDFDTVIKSYQKDSKEEFNHNDDDGLRTHARVTTNTRLSGDKNATSRNKSRYAYDVALDRYDDLIQLMSLINTTGYTKFIRLIDGNILMMTGLMSKFLPVTNLAEDVRRLLRQVFNMPLVDLWAHADLEKIVQPQTHLVADFYLDQAQMM